MPIPGSGPIGFDMLRNEFSGGNPVRASDYYRGGPRVPNSAPNANVPTSGIMYLSSFRGATNAFVNLTSKYLNNYNPVKGSSATAGITLQNNGQATVTQRTGTDPVDGEWGIGLNAGDYEVLRTNGSLGSAIAGPAAGTWHNLGTTRSWTLTQNDNGQKTADMNLQIRKVGTSTILANVTISIDVAVGVLS